MLPLTMLSISGLSGSSGLTSASTLTMASADMPAIASLRNGRDVDLGRVALLEGLDRQPQNLARFFARVLFVKLDVRRARHLGDGHRGDDGGVILLGHFAAGSA